MGLKVTIQEKEIGFFRIIASGSIDTETYTILERALNPVFYSSPRALIFDMKEVDYISSMGLGVILKAREAMEKKGASLIITNLQPQVKKIFDIVKSLPNVDIFKDIAEADEYFRKMQRKELSNG
jgi:anti-sigma B factor antagonist